MRRYPLHINVALAIIILAIRATVVRAGEQERRFWYESATRAIEARISAAARSSVSGTTPPTGMARGVILFVGDGMGMSTLTAARILSGQRRGNTGEEAQLAWDDFPAVALARVTGAGHGIGKELAIGYALLGAIVICWDINEEANEQTKNEIKKMGKDSVYAYRCDVTNREEVFKVAEKVKKEVGDVTILINNAGVGIIKTLLNYSNDEITRTINVNFTAHYWTLRAFLPSMIEKNHGHVVAVSSILAIATTMYATVYSPTKSAVEALMESLNEELRLSSNGKSLIKFTTVFPTVVFNGMFKKPIMRFPSLISPLFPKEAASLIIDAQRQNCRKRGIPFHMLLLLRILRILPDKAQECIKDFGGLSAEPDE